MGASVESLCEHVSKMDAQQRNGTARVPLLLPAFLPATFSLFFPPAFRAVCQCDAFEGLIGLDLHVVCAPPGFSLGGTPCKPPDWCQKPPKVNKGPNPPPPFQCPGLVAASLPVTPGLLQHHLLLPKTQRVQRTPLLVWEGKIL